MRVLFLVPVRGGAGKDDMARASLNEFSASFAQVLFEAFPALEAFGTIDPHAEAVSGSLLVEFSPPPAREDCLFWVSTDCEEITVGFGLFHTHFAWPQPDDDPYWEHPIDFMRDLMNDRILVEDWLKDGAWAGSSTLKADQEPDLSGLEADQVVMIRSWSGTRDRIIAGTEGLDAEG